ncbi:unnamed protein product [Commensalibacter communis]|uniref:hypothetical protein n=1 Tax=Commensalibacter communis TaxID=2972786 RepID=UPI0022FF57BF|nr:hypothetical protein [Commensalibacter communis]CAI3952843.1 unnamed protein product [Commensalibacter communis]CAI3960810.1 unnamed protein product [Commensalibacter communis]
MMNTIFPTNKTRKILDGENRGNYIKIILNEDNSFLILLTRDWTNPSIGFDDWFANQYALIEYFKETRWITEWLDQDYFSNP